MRTTKIGKSDLVSSILAYGCMRIGGSWDPARRTAEEVKRGVKAVIAAYEAGYTLFDHANIYCRGESERVFGEALRQVPEMRRNILIASKCGLRFAGDPTPEAPPRYDFSGEHILRACEASLCRLGVETIDLYQLHRPDFLAHPDEVASAFATLKQQGKVREFGVSNFRPSLVSTLQKACSVPLQVNQIEVSLLFFDPLTDGTLDQCLAERMTPLVWSPLAGGMLGDGGKPRGITE